MPTRETIDAQVRQRPADPPLASRELPASVASADAYRIYHCVLCLIAAHPGRRLLARYGGVYGSVDLAP